MKNYILGYINKITKEDIEKFGIKNNIKLNKNEINNIYKIIKDKNILNYNDDKYYFIIKKNIENENVDKVYSLLIKYKKKYQNYL